MIRMLGIDDRALRVFWTLFVLALVLFVIYKIAGTLIVFALAIFLAQLLSPLVDFAERIFPGRYRRVLAIIVVYAVMIGITVAIAIPIGSNIAQQAVAFAERLPEILKSNPLQHIRLPNWLEPERDSLNEYLSGAIQQFGSNIPSVTEASRRIMTGAESVLNAVLIPIIGFMFLVSGSAIRREVVNFFDPNSQRIVDGVLDDLQYLISHYIRALILLSIATFVVFSSVLSLMRAPFSVLMAGIAALLEVVPVLGPLTAAISIVVVAALSGYPHIVWLIIFLTAYRVFQDYVLSPYLMAAGVELHPLWVLFGVLAGERLAGIPGMFFSVPVIAAIRMLLLRTNRTNVQ
ncbi:MAG: AI-2E family transporter [Bryobacterales bacterium]|nr:AI-2E family transporter [Bryobacterales bacterium]MBV9401535.1 AI-2E family transporter [Bryobacterales bacterium]